MNNPMRVSLRSWAAGTVTYFALAAATVSLTRLNGGVALLWLATAFLVARLSTSHLRDWPLQLAGCALASAVATGLFGVGWVASGPLALINVCEALVAVALLRRWQRDGRFFESLGGMVRFGVVAGLAAPALTATAGAVAVSWVTDTGYLVNWGGWFIGHALGTLTFTPIFLLLMRGELRRWWIEVTSGPSWRRRHCCS